MIAIGCQGIRLELPEDFSFASEFVSESDSTVFLMSNDVLQRAYQMATIEWTPLNPVPKCGGGIYSAGDKTKGVPYSSVKEINTYLFQDVSYHTFMTAVHNPNSVLYTEDISQAPYHGVNCAPYYGAVCSSSVMWALGIQIPYYANQLISHPDISPIKNQVIDSLKTCDLIWKPGHVQMIFDMVYQADTLYSISTFETSGNSTHIRNYRKSDFQRMWDNGGYIGYRYKTIRYSTTPPSFIGFETIVYNDDLCPSKGDKAVYRTMDTVTVNVFNPYSDSIVLSKGNEVVSTMRVVGDKYQYYNLPPGIYMVVLEKNGENSASISFEIVETDVHYLYDGGDYIIIYFNSSATPVYAALCDKQGKSKCYPISEQDKTR